MVNWSENLKIFIFTFLKLNALRLPFVPKFDYNPFNKCFAHICQNFVSDFKAKFFLDGAIFESLD